METLHKLSTLSVHFQLTIYNGMGFHRLPISDHCWIGGNDHMATVRQVFICSSAMEALAWLHVHFHAFSQAGSLLFLATGTRPGPGQFRWIRQNVKCKQISLIFTNDLPGRACDLKTAAALHNQPAAVFYYDQQVSVSFRNQYFEFNEQAFSLNAFEKASGYRFGVRTLKPKGFCSWLDLLKFNAFKL